MGNRSRRWKSKRKWGGAQAEGTISFLLKLHLCSIMKDAPLLFLNNPQIFISYNLLFATLTYWLVKVNYSGLLVSWGVLRKFCPHWNHPMFWIFLKPKWFLSVLDWGTQMQSVSTLKSTTPAASHKRWYHGSWCKHRQRPTTLFIDEKPQFVWVWFEAESRGAKLQSGSSLPPTEI